MKERDRGGREPIRYEGERVREGSQYCVERERVRERMRERGEPILCGERERERDRWRERERL